MRGNVIFNGALIDRLRGARRTRSGAATLIFATPSAATRSSTCAITDPGMNRYNANRTIAGEESSRSFLITGAT